MVEDQVTYPLTTAILSVPRAVTVRGYSFFGDSDVYVIFADGTDPYWARTRVLEYLNQSLQQRREAAISEHRPLTADDIRTAVIDGALRRVRPVMMTAAAIIAGLLPIMLGGGTGSEVMRRIAAPMVGGMVSATLLTLVVIPAVFLLWKRRGTAAGSR